MARRAGRYPAARATARSSTRRRELCLNVKKSLVEVRRDVFDVFDAHGEPHESFRDTNTILHLFGHRGVRHQSRKGNQCFDAAETFCKRAKLYVIEESTRGVERAEIESQHRAGTLLLAACDFVLRMRLQTRIKHLAHFRMCIQVARHADAVGVVLQHSNRKRLDSAGDEKAIHWREAR